MDQYIQLIFALVGVIGLILLFFWALRKYNKGMISMGGRRLKIIDRASLGGEKSVVVVSIAGKLSVLGVTAGRIDKIEDLSCTEEEYLEMMYPKNGGGENGGFFAAFTEALVKNARTLKKGGNTQETADFTDTDRQKEAENNDDT